MKHVLRKYLSRRGSALFMVLSLMTALMVLVMAMYFSVVASRETQYKVFYQEQSYRSAISLSDAIVTGLMNDSWNKDAGSDSFFSLVLGLDEEGDSISTNGNNFAAFLESGGIADPDQLGAYTVTITYLGEEDINGTNTKVYDIIITISVGDVIDTAHTYIYVEAEEAGPAPAGLGNIFASTGYAPNDAFLETGFYMTDLFCDNEYVAVGAYGGALTLGGNFIVGGSLSLYTAPQWITEEAITMAVRNNLTCTMSDGNANLEGDDGSRGLLLVGGDYTYNSQYVDGCDIYVLGDMYVNGLDMTGIDNLYVHGDIIFSGTDAGDIDTLSTVDNIFCDGSLIAPNASSAPYYPGNKAKWENNDNLNGGMSISEMAKKLDSLTAGQTFYNWEIDYDVIDAGVISDNAAVDETITIEYNAGAAENDNGIPAGISTYYFDWQDKVAPGYNTDGSDLHYSAVTIRDIKLENKGDWNINYDGLAVVFDTGDDPQNQYIVRLMGNEDTDGDGIPDTDKFCWLAEEAMTTLNMCVIVRGAGSLVIDCSDVKYEDYNWIQTMHETWFVLSGGTITPNPNNSVDYDTAGKYVVDAGRKVYADDVIYGSGAVRGKQYDFYQSYVHVTCDEDCSDCDYGDMDDYVDASGDVVECSICGENLQYYYCDTHEYTYSFCNNSECANYLPPSMDEHGDAYGLCANRLHLPAVDAKLNSSIGYYDRVKNADGSVDRPTTNIFLVSVEENADIRLARSADGVDFSQNKFFGFLYAPYMTMRGYVFSSGSGGMRMLGGMIVSDYIIQDWHSFMGCYPTFMPNQLMGNANASSELDPLYEKGWKISLAGY